MPKTMKKYPLAWAANTRCIAISATIMAGTGRKETQVPTNGMPREVDAQHVQTDGRDEHQRSPVLDLPEEQPAAKVEGDV